MRWSKKNRESNLRIESEPISRVEIELHKSESQEAKAKADQVNKHVKQLLEENGFTVKIALAAGRKHINMKPKGL